MKLDITAIRRLRELGADLTREAEALRAAGCLLREQHRSACSGSTLDIRAEWYEMRAAETTARSDACLLAAEALTP